MDERPLCPECSELMAKRQGKYGEFWGCSRYPHCRGIRTSKGKAKPPSVHPERKDQSRREAHNQVVGREIAASALIQDGQPCPFDDVPGPNDVHTAFGRIGQPLAVVETAPTTELDREYAAICGRW